MRAGNVVGATTMRFGATRMSSVRLTCCAVGVDASRTRTVGRKTPSVVGVPEMIPFDALRRSPGGSVPAVSAQVKGFTPAGGATRSRTAHPPSP